MPLIQSSSKKALDENIKTEIDSGKPRDQAVAIAYSVADKAKSSPVDRRMGLDQDKAKKISDSFKKVF